MEPSRRSVVRFVPPLALLLACAVPLACFKPAVVDGGFKCNTAAGAKRCPDGFTCDTDGFCKRHPTDGGRDMITDGPNDGDAPTDLMPETMCIQPVAGCTSGPGMCDPACQTGCTTDCRAKCSVNTAGVLTCNEPKMTGYPKGVMDVCQIDSLGLPGQTDNCGPGLVCIDSCGLHCFKFCKSDGDCSNATCTRDVVGPDGGATGQKICDVPFVDSCVPLPGTMNTGCGPNTGTMSCYISSTSPTHTICDCPMGASGNNGPCTRSRECVRGLTCVDRGDGAPTCLQTCRLNLEAGNDCVNQQVCHPYQGIPRGSVSNPNFGYCL